MSIKGSEDADALSVEVEIEGETIAIPHFRPRPLRNLLLVDDVESLSPIIDAKAPAAAARAHTHRRHATPARSSPIIDAKAPAAARARTPARISQ